MKKNCEQWMEEYLMLDKNQKIPAKLSMHLISCKKCSAEIKALSYAEKLSSAPLKIKTPVKSDTITNLMNEIEPGYMEKRQKGSLASWIIMGLLMIIAMSFFTIITSGATDHKVMFAFYAIFALCVVGYCASFIGLNLDFFIKKVNTIAL